MTHPEGERWERPRIAVVTTSFPRWPGDHAGCFVADRVDELRASGAHVEVVTPTRTDPAIAPLLGEAGAPDAFERARGLDRVRLAVVGGIVTARLLAAARAATEGCGELESHWLVPCGVIGALVADGRPHRAWAHGADVATLERAPAGSALARWLVRSGAKLAFVSDDLRVRFARLAQVPPASSSLELASLPVRRPRAFGPIERDGGAVLGVGRLVPIKGFDVLVRAVGRLPRAARPRVVLLGDGPERARLERLARRCEVALDARGTVPRDEVAAQLSASGACVIPSRVLANGRSEGLPMVAREALAAGTPVVATATGGLAALGGTPGVTLVPPEDPCALALAVGSVMRMTLRTE